MEEIQVLRGVTVVTLAANYDSLDEEATRRIDTLLREQADRASPPAMVLDMSQTQSIGSTFVGSLFAADKRLRRRGGQMALCQVGEFCLEVLRAVRSDTLFKIFATRDEAVAALAAPPSTA
jgi:anti-anti-sigma factor